MDILKETKLISNYRISLRKDFHRYPELSMEEYRTSKRIKEELDKIGVKYEDAIKTLKKHLELETATWKDERCASMRFISRCYKYLNNYSEAKNWAQLAIKEAPHLRDPFVEKGLE